MSLSPGTRVGSYEVVAALGAGGMGEVFQARDTRLNRTVAIKALQSSVLTDPERIARFEREAQLLASLHHPNIAGIYGLEQEGAATYLVLEFVDGKSLDAVVRETGAMAPRDAVAIARQIADAIAAAHEKGIIHRDLKPGNVMITPDGQVKVLDFGLGKSIDDAASAGQSAANSPTVTLGATQAGVVLGTAGYMSPEQAKGRPADRRSDVWSFGCLLFELLAGSRAFDGEDITDTIAAIVRGEPNMKALPATTTPALRQLVERCLVKDRTQRLSDMSVVRYILNEPGILDATAVTPVTATGVTGSRNRGTLWLVSTAALGLVTLALAYLYFTRAAITPAAAPIRFTIAYPSTTRPLSNGADNHGVSLSPDGEYVAFSAADRKTGQVAIYLRRLSALDAFIIPGTEDGRYPFWSPDSKTIAFYSQGKLKRINIDGSLPKVICDAPTGGWGGAWNDEDVIVAGLVDPGPLLRVSAKGDSAPVVVTTIGAGDFDHDWPHFLPDGRHFIYSAWSNSISVFGSIFVGSLDPKESSKQLIKEIIEPAGFAKPNYLLILRSDTLTAQELDLRTFELHGEPLTIGTNATNPISTSATGMIGYTTRPRNQKSRIAWINVDGTQEQSIVDPGYYADPSVSPDGTRIAYGKKDSEAGSFDIWVRDVASGAEQRLTFDPANEISPVWSPDGSEIIYRSDRKPEGLYRKRANGTGEEKLVALSEKFAVSPYQWRADNTVLAYGGEVSTDILKISLADSTITPVVTSKSLTEQRAAVSPDGKWLAYDSRETARFEVYLTTYPPSAGSRWMVTTTGGAEPKWSKDGRQLFYVAAATGALMVAAVVPGDPPRFTSPRMVHPGELDWGFGASHSFDLDPKGGRALVTIQDGASELTVLANWLGLVKK
jgi:serine/threonine protein kinase/Tol biopolymer transport system component